LKFKNIERVLRRKHPPSLVCQIQEQNIKASTSMLSKAMLTSNQWMEAIAVACS
jgi:hypothetical protein